MQGNVAEALDAATPTKLPVSAEVKAPDLPAANELGHLPVEASVEPLDGPEPGQAAVIRPAVRVKNIPITAEGPKDIPVDVTYH